MGRRSDAPVAQLLAPQSKYLFEFDLVLLLHWSQVAPPTSVDGAVGFLLLMSQFADGRTFFMDDPRDTLARNGIAQADFTVAEPWDRYPIVKTFLAVWQATEDYVSTFVDVTYPSGSSPAKDAALQSWIQKAADTDVGNVPGLPPQINTNDELKRVLTSLLYRITIHGSSRLLTSANPGLTYVANFPPCLQDAAIPAPTTPLTPKSLFAYLPVTGTIGKMATFYYTFAFSRPYESFVPEYGVEFEAVLLRRSDRAPEQSTHRLQANGRKPHRRAFPSLDAGPIAALSVAAVHRNLMATWGPLARFYS